MNSRKPLTVPIRSRADSESIAMRDVHATMRTVADLREAGLLIALDDFGTGYSSLAHLKRLPIDVVKIDGAFTAGVPNDPHDAAIVEAVQFERQGYFCADPASTPGHLVFNRTVGLRDTWAKVQKRGG